LRDQRSIALATMILKPSSMSRVAAEPACTDAVMLATDHAFYVGPTLREW